MNFLRKLYYKRKAKRIEQIVDECKLTERERIEVVSHAAQEACTILQMAFLLARVPNKITAHSYDPVTDMYFEITFKRVEAKDIERPETIK
jgi:hypothetical protein